MSNLPLNTYVQQIKERSISALVHPQDLNELRRKTGNIYEAIVIIGRRSRQINDVLSREIRAKMEEFSSYNDTFEEVQENQEQIEASRVYETLPNSALIALDEFRKDEIFFDTEQRIR